MHVFLALRAAIIGIVGAFLFAQCLDGLRRGVTIFKISRAEAPGRFWPLVAVQILVSGAMLLYALHLYDIARGRKSLLRLFDLLLTAIWPPLSNN